MTGPVRALSKGIMCAILSSRVLATATWNERLFHMSVIGEIQHAGWDILWPIHWSTEYTSLFINVEGRADILDNGRRGSGS